MVGDVAIAVRGGGGRSCCLLVVGLYLCSGSQGMPWYLPWYDQLRYCCSFVVDTRISTRV